MRNSAIGFHDSGESATTASLPTEAEVSADQNLAAASQAMLICLEGIKQVAPELIGNHMPNGWGLHRVRGAFKQNASQRRDCAKLIVDQLYYGAQRTPWVQSAALEWQYSNLLICGHSLRVGVSIGGVISLDGDPFVPSSRVLCTTLETAQQSLNERLLQLDKEDSRNVTSTVEKAAA